jgi:hypothetical protein
MHEIESFTLVIDGDHPMLVIEELKRIPTFATLHPTQNGLRIEIKRIRGLTTAEHTKITTDRENKEKARQVLLDYRQAEELRRRERAVQLQTEWLKTQPLEYQERVMSKAQTLAKLQDERVALRQAEVAVANQLIASSDQAAIQDFREELVEIRERLKVLNKLLHL